MHERNPYNTPVDFLALSKQYPKLKKFLTQPSESSTRTIDFRNSEAQRCLTEALLWRDFGLKLSLPEGRLCPPVPNRLNYILWLQDILTETFRVLDAPSEIVGLDIGTGASAIYPLIGCKTDVRWKFVVTEIDPVSYGSAIANVQQNNLADRIKVTRVTSPDFIFVPFREEPIRVFSFTMCNPPFYADAEEIERSASSKEFEPNAACTGAEIEMITPGGEEAFVSRMVMESSSQVIRDHCVWFTSMLGKLSSLEKVVGVLRGKEMNNYAVTELVQGQTRRWVLAWTFSDVRLPDTLARNLPSVHHALTPSHNNLEQPLSECNVLDLSAVHDAVINALTPLADVSYANVPERSIETKSLPATSSGISTDYTSDEGTGVLRVTASRNSWSRKARRARSLTSEPIIGHPPVMIVDLSVITRHLKGRDFWVLTGAWRRGRDRELFESFWNHVSRKACFPASIGKLKSIPVAKRELDHNTLKALKRLDI